MPNPVSHAAILFARTQESTAPSFAVLGAGVQPNIALCECVKILNADASSASKIQPKTLGKTKASTARLSVTKTTAGARIAHARRGRYLLA
jgi:hypothetical protein